MASSSSLSAAASVPRPTGPPAYLSSSAIIRLRSTSSRPLSSTPSIASASCATARVMRPAARTSAKSRARRSSRLAMRDDQQIFRLVKIQPVHDSETRAQRGGNQSRARGRSDEREMSQLEGMNPRPWPLPDNQVHAKIFHRRIQHFFHRGLQAVNFIHEKNFLAFERGQYRGQVAFALQQRSRTSLDRHVQFVGDNLRQRRFSQPGRPVQQHVVQRFAAAPCRIDGNLDILFDAFLADVLLQPFRPHAHVDARVFVICLPGHNPFRLSLLHHPFCCSIRHWSPSHARWARWIVPLQSLDVAYDPDLALRPFGAVNDCSAARSSFSKFAVPAVRFASPTASSAAHTSYPRFTSAEITSASMPAGDAAAGLSASIATTSSLSFNSTTMRSAVFLPTPGIFVSRTRSLPRIAGTSSSTLIPLKIFSASVGPTPDAESSISKKCFSRADTNPYSASASSRTCVWIRRVTSVCSSPSAAYVESGTCTRYPTPPTSTSTWFGLFSASRPQSWPIIVRQYCRFSFARQREPRNRAPAQPTAALKRQRWRISQAGTARERSASR